MRNLPHGFDIYLVTTIRKNEQIFAAFSEKLNFKLEPSAFKVQESHELS